MYAWNIARLVCLTTLLSACQARVEVDNPYDPAAPPAEQQKASLFGVVSGDALDGLPASLLANAVVTLDGPTLPDNSPLVTDINSTGGPTGAFRFNDLTPGLYTLVITHPAHLPDTRELALIAGVSRQSDVTLVAIPRGSEEAGRISGVVQLQSQSALTTPDHSGVLVEVEDAGLRTVTNVAGEFDIFIGAGTYTLHFSAPDHLADSSSPIDVAAGTVVTMPSSPLTLLANPGSISGSVILLQADGTEPADKSGVTVGVFGQPVATTSADGTFLLAVPSGTHALTTTLNGFDSRLVAGVVVRAGVDTALVDPLVMKQARGTVKGNAQLGGGAVDHSGIAVSLDDVGLAAITNAVGNYVIQGVPVGVHPLTASRDGYFTASVGAVTVDPNVDNLVRDLTLAKKEGSFQMVSANSLSLPGYTNVTSVELSLTPPSGTTQIQINGDIDAAEDMRDSVLDGSTGWLPYPLSSTSFPLDAMTDGAKTLSVLFSDASVSSGPFSATIILDTLAPQDDMAPSQVPQVTINGGAAWSTDVGAAGPWVTLTFLADDLSSGIQAMQISDSNSFDDSTPGWDLFVPVKPFSFVASTPADGVASSVYVRYIDNAGNWSTVVSSSIKFDRVAPVVSLITIDCNGISDAQHCDSPLVELSISAADPDPGTGSSGVTLMALSNNSGFPVVVWEPFVQSRIWALNTGINPRNVYLMVQDEAGNKSTPVASDPDGVNLDLDPPTGVRMVMKGDDALGISTLLTRNFTVTVDLFATDANLKAIYLSNENDFTSPTAAQTFTPGTGQNWALVDGQQGFQTVYMRAVDLAGNFAESSASITLDQLPPTANFLEVSGRNVDGTSNALASATTTADLSVSATAAEWMHLSTAVTPPVCDAVALSAYAVAYSPTLSWPLTTGDLHVCFSDAAGNRAGPLSGAITLDTTAPTGTLAVNGGSAATTTRVASLSISGASSDVVDIMFANDASFSGAYWQNYVAAAPVPWLLSPGDDPNKEVFARLRDGVGNLSTPDLSDTITLDTSGPGVPNLFRTMITDTAIVLAWTKPSDSDLAGYVLERRMASEGSFARLAPGAAPALIAPDTLAFTDSNVTLGEQHHYRIYAIDTRGNASSYSIQLAAGVPIAPLDATYSMVSPREINWRIPKGTSLLLANYYSEDLQGVGTITPLAVNGTRASLPPGAGLFNERLTVRASNFDGSLTWETDITFGNIRKTLDSDGFVGTEVSIAMDSKDVVHLLYRGAGGLNLLVLDGASTPLVLDSFSNASNIAIDSNDIVHVSYREHTNASFGKLRYLKVDGVSTPQVLDTGGNVYDTSIAIDSTNTPHISYWDEDTGDLKYIKVDGASTPLILDSAGIVGASTAIAIDSLDKPHISYYDVTNTNLKYVVVGVSAPQTLDSSGSVGSFTAIAIDPVDVAHIAYYSATNYDIKYLKVDGVSIPQVLDSVDEVGEFPSIAIDTTGIAHISYHAEGGIDATRNLMYVRADGVSSPQVLDGPGWTGRYTAIALDSNGTPHIGYEDFTNRDLKYVRLDGAGTPSVINNLGGARSITVDSNDVAHVSLYDLGNSALAYVKVDGSTEQMIDNAANVGESSAIAVDSSDTPHIAYYDTSNGELKYVVLSGAATPQVLDTRFRPTGLQPAMVIDNSDIAHITYTYNASNDQLMYLYLDGSAAPQSVDVVGGSGTTGQAQSSIVIDSQGIPHISYNDYPLKEFWYAKLDGASAPVLLDTVRGLSSTSSIALDSSDTAHVAYHDIQSQDLKYVHVDGANTIQVLDAPGDVGAGVSMAIDANDIPHIGYGQTRPGNALKYLRFDGISSPQTLDPNGSSPAGIALDSRGVPHLAYARATGLAYIRGPFSKTPDSSTRCADGAGSCRTFVDLLADDFATGSWDASIWASVIGAATVVSSESYSDSYSLQFAGTGGTATSNPADTRDCVALDWMFAGKRGPDAPEIDDTLVLQYFDGSTWVTAFTWTASGTDDAAFFLHSGTITDTNAFLSTFEMRLSSSGGVAGQDHFYVDDFVLRCWSAYR